MNAIDLFNPPDVDSQYAAWGANCGPCALAALLGRTVASVKNFFPNYPDRPWTNPTHMSAALAIAHVRHKLGFDAAERMFPAHGLAFVQWEGSWLNAGVPIAAAYKRTHWVASHGGHVYDVNAREWLTIFDWAGCVVPRLLAHTKGSTGWHVRTGIEVTP